MSDPPSRGGFTLIEVLLVVGIVAILATIVIISVSPLKQSVEVRNTERRAHVNTILDAVEQYAMDHALPADITTEEKEICQSDAQSCMNGVDLSVLTASGKYLVTIPVDPLVLTGTGTDYAVWRDAQGRLNVRALAAEQDVSISVTR